ncbi:hypothetical protein B0H15DRAFT_952451 [Mycena belliarum]|uniref:Uncharacterized protein n=1 Tax=Mycena belliarum TaxID=1033014 RepID=A0AAD6XJ49_9AGAR|nr:hypothetical protein B0H15DRAFT_952451 [Mycena belliae]
MAPSRSSRLDAPRQALCTRSPALLLALFRRRHQRLRGNVLHPCDDLPPPSLVHLASAHQARLPHIGLLRCPARDSLRARIRCLSARASRASIPLVAMFVFTVEPVSPHGHMHAVLLRERRARRLHGSSFRFCSCARLLSPKPASAVLLRRSGRPFGAQLRRNSACVSVYAPQTPISGAFMNKTGGPSTSLCANLPHLSNVLPAPLFLAAPPPAPRPASIAATTSSSHERGEPRPIGHWALELPPSQLPARVSVPSLAPRRLTLLLRRSTCTVEIGDNTIYGSQAAPCGALLPPALPRALGSVSVLLTDSTCGCGVEPGVARDPRLQLNRAEADPALPLVVTWQLVDPAFLRTTLSLLLKSASFRLCASS